MNWDLILKKIIWIWFLILSIGISDGIEFFTNPLVHKIHNSVDIVGVPWSEYNVFHAIWSGIKCAWFLLIFFIFLPFNAAIYNFAIVINVLVPIAMWVFGFQKKDTFLSHKILYLFNTLIAVALIVSGFVNKKKDKKAKLE